MSTRALLLASLCLPLWAACGAPGLDDTRGIDRQALSTQSIAYVGKQSITDFTGLGQHLQYWPLFGLTSPETARRTDDPNCIELTPDFASFKHHDLLPDRTFSNDALGVPIGTKTRGGFDNWAAFTLPDGTVGRSGTFYDTSNIDNANNTVNQLRINVSTLHEFCLNLVTDNTAHEHDADVRLEARSDDVDLSLEGNPDLSFDGQTDMYTFRYEGMQEGDLVKIRFQCSSASGCQGAGLGGILVSDIATCTPVDAGTVDVDAGTVDAGTVDAGTGDAGTVEGTVDAGTKDAGAPPAPDGVTDPLADTDVDAPSGCGCHAAHQRGTGADAGLLLLLAGLMRRATRMIPDPKADRVR